MADETKKLLWGILLLAGFVGVLVVIFMPLFDGQNALNYMDSLYNSISKGSANYIPQLREEAAGYAGQRAELALDPGSPDKARLAATLLQSTGAAVEVDGATLTVSGDLGGILGGCLQDAAEVFENQPARIEAAYGVEAPQVMFGWWTTLKALDKSLKKQEQFELAAFVLTVKKKGVECAYNYYGIVPRKIADNVGIVLLSLVFYVLYTVWYGYAIILVFEGCGFKLSH